MFRLRHPYHALFFVLALLSSCREEAPNCLPSLGIRLDAADAVSRMDADKRHREQGVFQWVGADGDTLAEGRVRWMHGRGHSTWEQPKRPYNFRLEEKAALVSDRARRRYILLANYTDPSALRNLLALEAAGRLMTDVPRCRLVELSLGGCYHGLYLLTEAKRKGRRVADLLTYCRMDVACSPEIYAEAQAGFVSDNGEYVAMDTPNTLPAEQLDVLKRKFDEMERAVGSVDGLNPETGRHFTDYIDLRSFALYYIIEEVYLNQDAGMGSFYVTWSPDAGGGCFAAGPAWDFDLALGRPENPQHMQSPEVFYARTPIVGYGKPTWKGLLFALWQHEAFREEVCRLYAGEVAPVIRAQFEAARFDSLCQVVLPSARRDCRKWHRGASPEKGMRQMRDFMLRRLDFLDRMWTGGQDGQQVSVWVDNGWTAPHHLAEFKVEKDGRFVPPLIDRYRVEEGFIDATPEGWYYGDTDSPAVAEAPVVRPITLKMRWRMGLSMWGRVMRRLRKMWGTT